MACRDGATGVAVCTGVPSSTELIEASAGFFVGVLLLALRFNLACNFAFESELAVWTISDARAASFTMCLVAFSSAISAESRRIRGTLSVVAVVLDVALDFVALLNFDRDLERDRDFERRLRLLGITGRPMAFTIKAVVKI